MLNSVFVPFQCGILGQVWYLIISIPDLCHLSHFKKKKKKKKNNLNVIRNNFRPIFGLFFFKIFTVFFLIFVKNVQIFFIFLDLYLFSNQTYQDPHVYPQKGSLVS